MNRKESQIFSVHLAIDQNVKKEKLAKKKGSKTRYPQREIGLPWP
jgi:hypothetical protein